MSYQDVHLKRGRNASLSTQSDIVLGLYDDYKIQLSKLFVTVTRIVEKGVKDKTQLSEKEKNTLTRKWANINAMRQNFDAIKKEWEELGIKGDFPEWIPKEKYSMSYEWLESYMNNNKIIEPEESDQTQPKSSISSKHRSILDTTKSTSAPLQKPLSTLVEEVSSEDENVDRRLSMNRKSQSVRDVYPRAWSTYRGPKRLSFGGTPLGITPKLSVNTADGGRGPPDDDGSDDDDEENRDYGRRRSDRNGHSNRREDDDDRNNRQPHSPLLSRKNRQSGTITVNRRDKFDRDLYWEIPCFSGKYLDFPEFYKMFRLTVHDTDLKDIFKLNYLRMKLDARTKGLIMTYRSDEYLKAFQVIIDEYSSLPSVIAHVQKLAQELPVVQRHDDIDGLTLVVEQLRSIKSLFEHYELNIGLEMEIFRVFLEKIPETFSERYLRHLKNDTPSLEHYLIYLDDALDAARTKSLWLPYQEEERNRASLFGKSGRLPQTNIGRENYSPRVPWDQQRRDNTEQMISRPGPSAQRYARPTNGFEPPMDDRHFYENGFTYESKPYYEERPSYDDQPSYKDRHFDNGLPPRQHNNFQSTDKPLSSETDIESPERCDRNMSDEEIHSPCKECASPTHSMLYCKDVAPDTKLEIVKNHRLCFVCFKKGHTAAECNTTYRCVKCQGRHNVKICTTPGQPPKNEEQVHMISVGWDPRNYNESLKALFRESDSDIESEDRVMYIQDIGEIIGESCLLTLENSNKEHESDALISNETEQRMREDIVENVDVQSKHTLNEVTLRPEYEGSYNITDNFGLKTVEVEKGERPTKNQLFQLKCKGNDKDVNSKLEMSVLTYYYLDCYNYESQIRRYDTNTNENKNYDFINERKYSNREVPCKVQDNLYLSTYDAAEHNDYDGHDYIKNDSLRHLLLFKDGSGNHRKKKKKRRNYL